MFPGMPELASQSGNSIDELMLYIHLLMGVLFVGWGLFFVFCIYRFRAKKNPKADHKGAGGKLSKYAEVSVALIEAALLLGISIPFWMKEMDLEAAQLENADVHVKVLGQQFVWNAHYPGEDGIFGETAPQFIDPVSNPVGIDPNDQFGEDDVVTVNDIRLPVDKTVRVDLTSKDVIHNFYLPQMRVKRDAIPGQKAEIIFTPIKTGEWEIACAQLCGNGHYRMLGSYSIVTSEEYDQWLADQSTEYEGNPFEQYEGEEDGSMDDAFGDDAFDDEAFEEEEEIDGDAWVE